MKLKNCLKSYDFTFLIGVLPKDSRGKHNNRPHAFTEDAKNAIFEHIKSYRGRKSHYSLHDSRKLYLPDTLNVQKMHEHFTQQYPNQHCSYESYRKVFVEKFNISFGYPRKDTCSTCDELKTKIDHFKAAQRNGDASVETAQNLQEAQEAKTSHLEDQKYFYERKNTAAENSKGRSNTFAVAFDFWKNLPCPNVTTSEVYYKRQLSIYSFNIHVLTTNDVYIYFYNETEGKKRADDVCSMLLHFCENHVPEEVTEMYFFCDGCAGQNKNWTVFRFMHYLVHEKKRFKTVKMTFPVTGHSYMECDKDIGLVKQTTPTHVPDDWKDVIVQARKRPSPFNVIPFDHTNFFSYTKFLRSKYRITCPVQTRPIHELKFEESQPEFMLYRSNWNGQFFSADVRKKKKSSPPENVELEPSYPQRLAISDAKYSDLQSLKKFCDVTKQSFYDALQKSSTEDQEDTIY